MYLNGLRALADFDTDEFYIDPPEYTTDDPNRGYNVASSDFWDSIQPGEENYVGADYRESRSQYQPFWDSGVYKEEINPVTVDERGFPILQDLTKTLATGYIGYLNSQQYRAANPFGSGVTATGLRPPLPNRPTGSSPFPVGATGGASSLSPVAIAAGAVAAILFIRSRK